MADFKLTLDISQLEKYLSEFSKEIDKDIKKEIKGLVENRYNHIKEEAQNKLHSFRDEYLDNLSPPVQTGEYEWEIVLNSDASWIEIGIPQEYDMKEGLLNTRRQGKGEIKTVKSGKNQGMKYRIVPMNQNKTPSEQSSGRDSLDENGNSVGKGFEADMRKKVLGKLRELNISSDKWKNLQLNENGSPRIGKVAEFSIKSPIVGKGNTEVLARVLVHQREVRNKRSGKTEIQRQITTFRTVTEKGQDDKWWHPPVKPTNFFKDAAEWAEKEWINHIIPQLVKKYEGK